MTGLKVVCRHLADAVVAWLARRVRAVPVLRRALRLPHRRIRDLSTWIAAEGASGSRERDTAPRYDSLYPSTAVSRPVPSNALGGATPAPLAQDGFHAHHEVFLARLPNARLLGPHGTVLTATGEVVEESTWGGGWLARERALRALRLPSPTRVDGEHYTIASASSEGYAHWLLDVLPRLIAFPHVVATQPPLVVARPLTSWQAESLDVLGFSHVPRVVLGDRYLVVDVLQFPSFVGSPGQPHPWACEWLRERVVGPARPRPHRRVYVTRRLARRRRVVNEGEITPILRDFGFEIVECEALTFREQIDHFRDAEMVVGPHGAGLTNLLWAPSGCRVLELFGRRCVRSLFYALAALRAQPYSFLVGDSVGSVRIHGDDGFYDMRVPPKSFAQALRAMLDPAAMTSVR
jgi:hypothetical protein